MALKVANGFRKYLLNELGESNCGSFNELLVNGPMSEKVLF
jgi:hypothetical protein